VIGPSGDRVKQNQLVGLVFTSPDHPIT